MRTAIKSIMFAALALACFQPFAYGGQPGAETPDIWRFNGHVYKFCRGSISWDDAVRQAKASGGQLVSIKSEEENAFIFSKIKDIRQSVYIGASDARLEGSWKWQDGSPVSYAKWLGGHVNDTHGDEHYAAFSPLKAADCWVLTDKDCAGGYICFWENEDIYNKSLLSAAPAAGAVPADERNPAAPASATAAAQKPVADASPSAGEEPVANKSDELKKKDAAYNKAALAKLENQLNDVESFFWQALATSKSTAYTSELDRKLSSLTIAASDVQRTLVLEHKAEGINLATSATTFAAACRKFTKTDYEIAGKALAMYRDPSRAVYDYSSIKSTSRAAYGKPVDTDSAPYLAWLKTTCKANNALFRWVDRVQSSQLSSAPSARAAAAIARDTGDVRKALPPKISAYFTAIENLRRDIVTAGESGLFDENNKEE